MSALARWMDEAWYPTFRQNWDDHLFRETILEFVAPESTVLDLGAGAGIVEQMNFRGIARKVCGVDVDARVLANPMLDEGRIADAARIPYGDGLFDIVLSDNVLEHLATPLEVLREVTRVLRPGGVFLFKTPNKWHYMPTIARITPHSFHRLVNRLRGRAERDTFPTRYRANTSGSLTRLAGQAGLKVERLQRIEGRPEYLRMSAFAYPFGFAYERAVNATELLSPFRILLIGALRKPNA
jgi:SAM-dependent methyltransferase